LVRGKVAIFNRSQQTAADLRREETAGNSSAQSPGSSSGSELKRVVDAAAARVDEIVDDAERVASEIIAEAETEADSYLEGRRRDVEQAIDQWSADLRGLGELLSRQENRLRELTEAMLGELEEIAGVLRRVPPELDRRRELTPEGVSAAPQPPPPERPRQPRTAAERGAQEAEEVQPEARDRSAPHGREAALLRAAQMAVGGSSRDEIERALQTELSISDPAPIVDELLGPRR
jgi:F0F1-type ATP synthase membrane subunit b/b'